MNLNICSRVRIELLKFLEKKKTFNEWIRIIKSYTKYRRVRMYGYSSIKQFQSDWV